jgi:hypothetical protein
MRASPDNRRSSQKNPQRGMPPWSGLIGDVSELLTGIRKSAVKHYPEILIVRDLASNWREKYSARIHSTRVNSLKPCPSCFRRLTFGTLKWRDC